jgi:hypothetical protein
MLYRDKKVVGVLCVFACAFDVFFVWGKGFNRLWSVHTTGTEMVLCL